jgi:WD40 repeat protein
LLALLPCENFSLHLLPSPCSTVQRSNPQPSISLYNLPTQTRLSRIQLVMAPHAPLLSSNAGLPPNSYIYRIISTAPRQDPLTYSQTDQLAIISSDDSLRFLDPATLSALPNGIVKNVNEKVTCLERANDAPSNVVATAGRDGLIRFWDKRSRQKVLEIESRMATLNSN